MKILFIQTGGTIDKDYPRATSGYAFEISIPAVQRIFEKLNLSIDYEILPLLQKDSLDLNDIDRNKILTVCKHSKFDKIIITHGTDTMIETAKVLSVIKNKVIVITGAKLPQRFTESDASFNVGMAVGVVSSIKEGVYIVMKGRVFPYNAVKRDIKSGKFIDI